MLHNYKGFHKKKKKKLKVRGSLASNKILSATFPSTHLLTLYLLSREGWILWFKAAAAYLPTVKGNSFPRC